MFWWSNHKPKYSMRLSRPEQLYSSKPTGRGASPLKNTINRSSWSSKKRLEHLALMQQNGVCLQSNIKVEPQWKPFDMAEEVSEWDWCSEEKRVGGWMQQRKSVKAESCTVGVLCWNGTRFFFFFLTENKLDIKLPAWRRMRTFKWKKKRVVATFFFFFFYQRQTVKALWKSVTYFMGLNRAWP